MNRAQRSCQLEQGRGWVDGMVRIARWAGRFAAVSGIALLVPSALVAQGTVTDGDASFSYVGGFNNAGTCSDRVNFVPGTVGTASDLAWQDWWWVGVGAAAEVQLPTPVSQSYVGDTATFTFTVVSGVVGLDATLVGRVEDGVGDNQAAWFESLTLTNNSAGALTLDVIQYADIEVGGTAINDQAALVAPADPSWIRMTDVGFPGAFQDHRAAAPSGYRVAAYSALCQALNNAADDDLLNTGLPFGPGDYTGAFEWRDQVLAPGQSRIFNTAIGIGAPALPGVLFSDGFESGDLTMWDSV